MHGEHVPVKLSLENFLLLFSGGNPGLKLCVSPVQVVRFRLEVLLAFTSQRGSFSFLVDAVLPRRGKFLHFHHFRPKFGP